MGIDECAKDFSGDDADGDSEIAADGAIVMRKAVAGERATEAGVTTDVTRADDGGVFERGGDVGLCEEGRRAGETGAGDGVAGEAAGMRRGPVADERAELRAGDLQARVGGALDDGFEVDIAGEKKACLGHKLQLLFKRAGAVHGHAHTTLRIVAYVR